MTQEENTGILGVSLVDNSLRIVEGKRDGNDVVVTQVAQGTVRQPFSYDVFTDKNIARRFSEDLTRLYDTQDFQVREVAFSLDSRMVLVKKIPVDNELTSEQIQEHIDWEVRQFAISPIKEYIVDFESLSMAENGSVKDMLVVVVRKKIVRYLKEIFRHTDLKLKVVDVDIFSAQRALQLNYGYSNGEKIGLIDVEQEKINFSILKGRHFYLAQDMETPSNNMDAEQHDESVTRLISKELRRIILDYHLGKSVEDLKEIFLYGEAVEDNVLEGLQNSYDVRIDRANPFKKIKLLPKVKEDVSNSRAESFVIAVGAALRGIQ